jgi:putative thioredoxin
MTLAPTAAAGEAHVSETTTASFRNDVLVGSMQHPVLVDFWAPWCGPCKQLAPALERAVKAADGKVRLFKMNIDEHPDIAKQLGIQSIPAVIAFQRGQPVDGFVGALPEGQITAFLERLVGPLGSDAEMLAAAEQTLADGDPEGAIGMSEAILTQDPENAKALSVYLRAMLALGETERAAAVMAALPDNVRADAALKQAAAALEIASQARAVGDQTDLQRRLEANPDDHQARFDLALALSGKGDRKGAADALLDIFKRDRTWNDDGARKQLLQFFEVWGPMDDATKTARRKLSSILFS